MQSVQADVHGERGYSLAIKLGSAERDALEAAIRRQYLSNIATNAPDQIAWFEDRAMNEYHLGCSKLRHDSIWSKRSRVLGAETVQMIKSLAFMHELEQAFGPFSISGESGIEPEEIYWRLVRPGKAEDVGPVHADQWFWALGNGTTPEGIERVKVWIAVITEPGRNGLQVVPGSHRREWQWHGEQRDGIMKPVFDQDPATIGLELPEYLPGQAIVFNDRLLHAGAINAGRTTRVSVEFTLFTSKSCSALN